MANSTFGLIGRKLGMTQIFDAAGHALGVTVVEVGPNTVVRVKTAESKDGYSALQLSFGTQRESRLSKAEAGHFTKAGVGFGRVLREVRVSDEVAKQHTPGQVLGASSFTLLERIDIAGTSKGCGFSGVMKRYNFSGFKRTHGVHEYHRHGGSIGTRLTPGMTFKGVKMPGHMGDSAVTIQNVQIVKIDAERNLLFLRGGVPGSEGGHCLVRKTVKVKIRTKR